MSLVLKISLIIIGAIILTEQIPNLFRYLYLFVQDKTETHTSSRYNFSFIIIAAVKIILGLLILGERDRIIEFIESRQKKNITEIEEEKR